jgi:hypothetical protein
MLEEVELSIRGAQQMKLASGSIVTALILALALSGCTSHDIESKTTDAYHPSFGPPPPSTLIVRFRGSNLPGAPPHNHTNAAAIDHIVASERCRVYDLFSPNYGGGVNMEVHMIVPDRVTRALTTKLEGLPGVYAVQTKGVNAFAAAPEAPNGVQTPNPCAARL